MYLTQGLHRAVQRQAQEIALVHLDDQGERRWTFAQLMDEVARQAAALQARGVRAGDRMVLLSGNSDVLIMAILACPPWVW
ncbi:hypothetical protein C5F52_10385 [Limnohabitans sp. TS-CS-82]|nr:AMP-binding protein [uncultured Limnohabitans sp.]PQA83114.1 hypothetical protein C5F52_10385 [Limnohabitans sp. TS-CS-82]